MNSRGKRQRDLTASFIEDVRVQTRRRAFLNLLLCSRNMSPLVNFIQLEPGSILAVKSRLWVKTCTEAVKEQRGVTGNVSVHRWDRSVIAGLARLTSASRGVAGPVKSPAVSHRCPPV